MNISIKPAERWLERHPKIKQWCWFVALWCGGLLAVSIIATPIKWLIQTMSAN